MPAETSLRDRRAALLNQPGLMGEEFCRAYAAEADAWLSALAERAAGGSKRHLALVAVGGYGRASLCPYSDLDVVLVHNGHRDIQAVADGIWYPVWDEGVHLDHSVRRPSEVVERRRGRPPRGPRPPRRTHGVGRAQARRAADRQGTRRLDRPAGHQVPADARDADGRAARHRRRRRLPARAGPEGESRWPARRERAAARCPPTRRCSPTTPTWPRSTTPRRCSLRSASSCIAWPGASTTSSCSRTRTRWQPRWASPTRTPSCSTSRRRGARSPGSATTCGAGAACGTPHRRPGAASGAPLPMRARPRRRPTSAPR